MKTTVRLEETKERKRLHIRNFFTDLDEAEYQELTRIFSQQFRPILPSFPTEIEIDIAARKRCSGENKRDQFIGFMDGIKYLHDYFKQSPVVGEGEKQGENTENKGWFNPSPIGYKRTIRESGRQDGKGIVTQPPTK